MNIITKLFICLASVLFAASVIATPVDTYEFKTTENQQRALSLAHQLRCPQCQNQNLVDSNSPVAQDLRLEVYKMVDSGKSDPEIIDFMTSRYGDFVLYKPKLDSKTYVLWLGPFGLLVFGLLIGFIFIRRQRIQPSETVSLTPEQQAELDALLNKSKSK
ncbi:heme lyase NrfEFG subunit NrfF [Shewanella inventionis]|uniref:Formate-dependent nitrite reductase complex subunit n=1 Tax=Shewanella inventionis TaxID=1738770 RepID=A0ABQ1JPF4_9GAMM|nr:heme lyase NrfEFG subunit NrfF [Shewanella inventionis]MCL1159666.1 heme lyase NrfEFG subunit NrfF [Shewanella inventionis]UAL43889.1 heme lyase NrfEFG subunit NrfF [Shewanella inventionis]GGB72211.1 cytochrome c biogenesis protein [Shewanella inventionis]